ncbi:Uroporphyrinogen decarboxylase [Nymphon striatum]|nr:Uroporphyrinogen decarboxylase [Nymphon striatum]
MSQRKIIEVMSGVSQTVPPIWVMRQAGRYLPEYRELRKSAKNFLEFCYTPDMAVEATMQPIRRFGFDGAILFCDILVMPDALGRDVHFVTGEGPRMTPITIDEINALNTDNVLTHLEPVFETINRLRSELNNETTLLGFCGAPWTVATYMIAGRGTPDQSPSRLFMYNEPEALARLLDILADASAEYLIAQIDAGADAVKIFDSWSGVLDEEAFERNCVAPVKRIVDKVRAERPTAKIIAFPKGAGHFYKGYREKTGVDMIALDWTIPLSFAADLQKEGAVQGNMDPLRVVSGKKAIKEGVDRIMDALERKASGDNAALKAAAAIAVFTAFAFAVWFFEIGDLYSWLKAFHVIAVISWMAGMVYLPRLFVYHTDSEVGSVQSETFKIMEKRLLKIIMTPAMLFTWVFGIILAYYSGAYLEIWFVLKLILVICMSACHGFFAKSVKAFAIDANYKTAKQWRLYNEIPTILMIFIVIMVFVKPFV